MLQSLQHTCCSDQMQVKLGVCSPNQLSLRLFLRDDPLCERRVCRAPKESQMPEKCFSCMQILPALNQKPQSNTLNNTPKVETIVFPDNQWLKCEGWSKMATASLHYEQESMSIILSSYCL